MTTKTIDPQHAADLYELLDYEHGKVDDSRVDETNTVDSWVLYGSTPIRTSRWHERYWLVIADRGSGETYGIEYGIGLTECQENELPWEGREEPLPLTRLRPHTVTTTVYRVGRPGS